MCKNTDAHKAQKTEKALIKFMKVKCGEQLLQDNKNTEIKWWKQNNS